MWFLFMNQSQGGGGKVMNFGKSKARVHKDDEKTRVTFKDVAGLQEEKEEGCRRLYGCGRFCLARLSRQCGG